MVQVMEGAQAWASYPEAADVGVLVLHGFTGNPVSMRPFAEALARAGFAVEMPRLPGHGTTWRELQKTTWHDWAREAAAALHRLRDRTRTRVVAGMSMGGTLALHLAQTRPDDVHGIVLINPSVYSGDPRLRALPFVKWVVPGLPGIGNDIAKPGGDERPYPRLPLRALASFIQLQRSVRADLESVTQPTLVLTSRNDHVVEPENSRMILDRIRCPDPEHVWLERSYHVATLDYDADLVVERATTFIRGLAGT